MADTLDILTAAESLAAINASSLSATLTTKLAMFTTGISRRVDELYGPVVVRQVVERHSPRVGETVLLLRKPPVSSITSVVEWDSDGTSTTLTAEDDDTKPADGYLLEQIEGRFVARLRRRSGGRDTYWVAGDNNIVVTYQAGTYANTAAVDPLLKLQVQDILAQQWHQSAGVWASNRDALDADGVPPFLSVDDMIRRRLETKPGGIA